MNAPRDEGTRIPDANAPQSIASRLFEEFLAAADRGAPEAITALCAAHPEHAEEL